MNACARLGCRRPLLIKKTKPSVYCSTRCRVADFRRRKRVRMMLRELGVDELVAQLRFALNAQQRGQSELRDVSLLTLATHPLVAGPRATVATNGAVSSSQKLGVDRIGKSPTPSAEESK